MATAATPRVGIIGAGMSGLCDEMWVAEDQADYAMWWIEQIRAGRIANAAPTETATKHYSEDIKAAIPQTIWASGCNSWYIGKDGLPEVFPWHPGRHRELLRGPVVTDYEVRRL